jgi:transposase
MPGLDGRAASCFDRAATPWMDDAMRTAATRRRHSRTDPRHASDLTEDEWRILEPPLPGAPRRGRRRAWPRRGIATAVFGLLRAGCTWRRPPDGFPPRRTACRRFARRRDGGAAGAINHQPAMPDRERAGRKRHAMGDADGRRLSRRIHPADIQDRGGAPRLMRVLRGRWPLVRLACRDGGRAGERVARATSSAARSYASPSGRPASPFMPGAGWSSAGSPESGRTAAPPRTARPPLPPPTPSSAPCRAFHPRFETDPEGLRRWR